MGYLPPSYGTIGTQIAGDLRGKPTPLRVCAVPFHPTSYKR
jgi:aminomethyltransferase